MTTLANSYIPELGDVRRGKVRDIYERDESLIIVASDRISCFDCILPEQIPNKGRILNEISHYWFQQTADIIPNHLLDCPDPNVLVAQRCKPLAVEVIVRGFICGSLWRAYERGERTVCGVSLPDGLTENQKLPQPIITPTTKADEGHDENITVAEILEQGLVEKSTWTQIESVALALFKRGQELAKQQGLVLVDTKYEFGLDTQGDLVLIDEIHTPDSSRFWFEKDHKMQIVRFPDKEFVRGWLKGQGFTGTGAIPHLPSEIVSEASKGYVSVYEKMVGHKFSQDSGSVKARLVSSLQRAKLIKGYFALILAGSESDREHVSRIVAGLEAEGIPNRVIVASAHKQPQRVLELINTYNQSVEPVVCIAVAGMSNALGGVLAANIKWPVINCPPADNYLVDIHSSLRMPRNVPAMTVVSPANAALATSRILKMYEE